MYGFVVAIGLEEVMAERAAANCSEALCCPSTVLPGGSDTTGIPPAFDQKFCCPVAIGNALPLETCKKL